MLEFFNNSLTVGLFVSLSASLLGYIFRRGIEIIKNRLPQKPEGVWPTSYFLVYMASIFCWVVIGLSLFVALLLIIEYAQIIF